MPFGMFQGKSEGTTAPKSEKYKELQEKAKGTMTALSKKLDTVLKKKEDIEELDAPSSSELASRKEDFWTRRKRLVTSAGKGRRRKTKNRKSKLRKTKTRKY